jgi:hypothetical protein
MNDFGSSGEFNKGYLEPQIAPLLMAEHKEAIAENELLKQSLSDAEQSLKLRDKEIEALKANYEALDRHFQINDALRSDCMKEVESLKIANSKLELLNGGLQLALGSERKDVVIHQTDLPQFIERVATLECALSDVAKESRDRLDKILELQSQNETANQVLNNIAFQLGFSVFDNEAVQLRIEQLMDRRLERSPSLLPEIENIQLKGKLAERDRQLDLIKDRDREIAELEDSLDRAKSEHLEQLRAIAQMIEPIKVTQYELGNDYTVGALRLIIFVVQNNIKKLEAS